MSLMRLLLAAAGLFSQQSLLAALAISSLAGSIDTTNNPASTASVNPTAASVTYLFVGYAVAGGGTTNNADSIVPSGARGTWTEIDRVTSADFNIARRAMVLFRGTGTVTSQAITITITPDSGTWTETAWSVIEVTGQDADPDDAALINGAISGTGATTADVGTVDAGDAVLFGVFHETDEAVSATGWTDLAAIAGGSDLRTLDTYYDATSPDETPNATWASSSTWAAMAMIVNVGAASAPTLSSPTPSGTLGTTTTATIGATTDDSAGDDFYAVVEATGALLVGITAAQIKAGNNNLDAAADASCTAAVSTSTPSCGVMGLTANTAYSYAAVQDNATGDSNIVTGTFTTAAAASSLPAALHLQRLMNAH